MDIQKDLFAMQDSRYRDFHAKLMPTVDKETIIGVRVPLLRAYAKKIKDKEMAASFLQILPHSYYEENNLHAFLIAQMRDFDSCLKETEKFLPYIDNWATCDGFSPQVFARHKIELSEKIEAWIRSAHVYTVRFSVCMLMRHFSGADFSPKHLAMVARVPTEDYYLHMVVAWYFAEMMVHHAEEVLPYFTEARLDRKTHNKAIQKARESYRISDEMKAYIKELKVP